MATSTAASRSCGRRRTTSFTVVSNTCMHLGCPVELKGDVVRVPLPRRPVRQRGTAHGRPAGAAAEPARDRTRLGAGHLLIGRVFASKEEDGKVVMSDTWKDPGQPVQGLLSFLYPAPPR